MAFSEVYAFTSSTVSTTEKSLTNNSTTIAAQTTIGIYQLYIDAANMTGVDEYEIAVQEKVVSGGTQRRIVIGRLISAQTEIYLSPPMILVNGWDFTMKKIAGTDRAFDWSIRSNTADSSQAYTVSAGTISTTEYSLTNNSTTLATQTSPGYYQVWVDNANVAAGDVFECALLEKVGSTQRRIVLSTFSGAQPEIFFAPTGYNSPGFFLMSGWDFSLKKTTGTDRAFDWSIRKLSAPTPGGGGGGGTTIISICE